MAQDVEERLRASLAADLEVIRPIGRGSHAYVFLAREPALKRLVAVKVLRPELGNDDVMRRRFEREAQTAARLIHPNVTPVHRVGRLQGDIPYIVMSYIDGRTLQDAIEATGPLPVGRARTVLAGLASALAAAHAGGIVHRDVRPGNVFLQKDTGHAVLADFGIAGLLETGSDVVTRLTESGVRLGDTRYMSPEQLEGGNASEQSDIYAFGILAYETLAGRGPYEAKSAAELIVAHLERQPTPLSRLVPGIDPLLADLIGRCLAKEPNRRPTAADLHARLTSAEPLPIEDDEVPGGAIVRFFREVKRRRVVKASISYIGFGAALVIGADELRERADIWPWFPRVAVICFVSSIPVAIMLTWIYDISGAGIRRTADEAGFSHSTAGRAVLVAALLIVSGLSLLLGWFLLRIL